MYSPGYYKEERFDLIQQLISEYSFATVLTEGNTDLISHLPAQLVMNESGRPELLSHCARANPHWQDLKRVGRAKLLFHGPHGYISPAWYPPKKDNVPTWNYAVVHVKGNFEIVEEPSAVGDLMSRFVNHFETAYETGWELPVHENAITQLMKGIVVFKVTGLEFEAKFKLSQKLEVSTREGVIQSLGDSELADYMKKTRSKESP